MRVLHKLLFTRCNRRSKGKERKLHELEGLESHGDADDGDAAKQTRNQVAQSQFPAQQDSPDDVGYGMLVELYVDPLAEGSEGQLGRLEALSAERNTDDGDAEQCAQDGPGKAQPQAAEDEPDDVCDEFHDVPLCAFV